MCEPVIGVAALPAHARIMAVARTRGISHLVFLFTRRDVVVVVVEVGASLALR